MQVTFRFYGPLNDFLTADRRGTRFGHAQAPGSVKDAIEAIGVPHPEVDLILVNGTQQRFDYQLQDADDVAVYPAFATLDAGAGRLTGDPPRPVRFAADIHLGRLTALLRIAGFDTVVEDEDATLAARAGAEQRVALTRDVGLLKRRAVRYGYWVRHTSPDLQLAEVLRRFDLAADLHPFTRCARCNGLLRPVSFETVAHRLPPRVRASQREFRQCTNCGRIYWPGTHYDRLRERLQRASLPPGGKVRR